MIRLVLLLACLAAIAFGAAWIADRPGEMVVVWQGWRLETTVPVALAALAAFSLVLLILAKLLSLIINSPKLIATFSRRRRREKGWQALSRGLLAIGAGDASRARAARDEAARLLPHEPLTHLLAAQSAQFDGNGNLAAKSFRLMLEAPETRVIALRGLYMEARRAGESESARAFAEEAAREAPALDWAADAAIEARCADGDFAGAREILERQMAARGIDKTAYRRRRAVLLAAEAIALEMADPAVAREKAVEAVRLAPTLVPAAAVAGRLMGAAGDLKRAARVLSAAYASTPHPDLAEAYAHLRPGDAALDRLKRVRVLAATAPTHPESIIALAHAAIDAQEFQQARAVLSPLTEKPTQRICLLMAELEAREHADVGKAREWAARAFAPRAIRPGSPMAWSRTSGRPSRPSPAASTPMRGRCRPASPQPRCWSMRPSACATPSPPFPRPSRSCRSRPPRRKPRRPPPPRWRRPPRKTRRFRSAERGRSRQKSPQRPPTRSSPSRRCPTIPARWPQTRT